MAVRASKFRHIFGDKNVKSYNGVPVSKNAHEQDFCSVNPKFVAVIAEQIGGGAFFVLRTDKVGGIDAGSCKISKHNGAVYDVRWSLFNDNLIASACDDGLVRLWNITDERGVEPNHSPVQTIKGHGKRVGGLAWHKSAENVIASSSYDNTVRLWDVTSGKQISQCGGFTNQITDMDFSLDGSQMATTCKDKKLRIFDTHTGEVAVEGLGHDNMKISRVQMLKDGMIFTAGFSSMSSRCVRLWDPRNIGQHVSEVAYDSSTGSLFPYYDPDLNLIYVAGKGDASIKFFEYADGDVFYLNQYMATDAQRGIGMMPRRGLDSTINEVARAYKLNVAKKLVSVIPLKVSRQSKAFAEDLFPDTASYEPVLTAEEFVAGKNAAPKLESFLELQKASATCKGFEAAPMGSGARVDDGHSQSEAESICSESDISSTSSICRNTEQHLSSANGVDNSKELATLKEEIATLKKTVTEKDAVISESLSKINALEETNEDLTSQLLSLEGEISELQRAGAEVEPVHSE